MPLCCPRCRRTHPDHAVFCCFDGTPLKQGTPPAGQLAQEFVFASGLRCRSFDELAHACYADWETARALLGDGTFASFFAALGRADLVQQARECQALHDRDLALSRFLAALPVTTRSPAAPRLGLSPRRLQLGPLYVGQQQVVVLRLKNEGTGQLQGKLQVVDGTSWLRLQDETIRTPREQLVHLHVLTRELTAGQTYAGKLVALTNGGAAELPVKLEVRARPFALAPYQGATSPHDLARKMRDNPKPAVTLLSNGEVKQWFASNGWTYPIVGPPAPGLACVQQYFEELGLAKPPVLRLSHNSLDLQLQADQSPQVPIVLTSVGRKLVYARAETNVPWLRLKQPNVSGQVSASIELLIDTSMLPAGEKPHQGAVKIIANANQMFVVPVRVTVQPKPGWFPSTSFRAAPSPPPPVESSLASEPALGESGLGEPALGKTRFHAFQALCLGAVLGLLLRALSVLPADLYARVLANPQAAPLPGSLQAWLTPPAADEAFLRLFVGVTWWLGPLLTLWAVARSGGKGLDYLCGLITGVGLGLVGMATLGCLLVLGDQLPRLLLSGLAPLNLSAPLATALWIALSLFCWLVLGVFAGGILWLAGPLGHGFLRLGALPCAQLLHLLGLENLARLFEPQRL